MINYVHHKSASTYRDHDLLSKLALELDQVTEPAPSHLKIRVAESRKCGRRCLFHRGEGDFPCYPKDLWEKTQATPPQICLQKKIAHQKVCRAKGVGQLKVAVASEVEIASREVQYGSVLTSI